MHVSNVLNSNLIISILKNLGVTLVILIFFNIVHASDYSIIYSHESLDNSYKIYAKNIQGLWLEDILGRLKFEDKKDLFGVKLLIPLVGTNKHPFDYYFNIEKKTVTLPIFTVKFIDDFAIALSWMDRNGCSMETVYDYIGMLRYQNQSNLNDRQFPPPLKALNIPSNALDDSYVNDVSGKILKTTIYFILAQQLGHIRYKHRGIQYVNIKKAEEQIIDADLFAFKLMKQISVPPVGVIVYLTAVSIFDKVQIDFKKIEDYEIYLKKNNCYPITPYRLKTLSKYIETNAIEYTRGQEYPDLWRKKVLDLAENFKLLGEGIDDPLIRNLINDHYKKITFKDLATDCDNK